MTVAALPRPRRTEPALLAGAGLVLALAVGVATAREPRMGLVLILAAIYVPLVLADPPLGIALWIAASFLDALGGVGLALSGGTVVILLAAVGFLFFNPRTGPQARKFAKEAYGNLTSGE